MQHLHKQKEFTPSMLNNKPFSSLIEETNNVFSKALKEGITRQVPQELTSALENNVFVFSGFKTYHELKEASLLLKDEEGGFKSFDKFYQDVANIDNKYNKQYLEAEYNFAVHSSQSAVKWNDYTKDADSYDLQFRTSQDDKVREDHAALDNTTLPFSDPFWDSFTPPLDWNCRCTYIQVAKDKYPLSSSQEAIDKGDKATTRIGKNGENKAAIFRFNPGKELKIFPPKHPYYKVPHKEEVGISKELQRFFDNTTIIDIEGVENVKQYKAVNPKDSDYKSVLFAAKELAKLSNTTAVITPKINNPSSLDYQKVYGGLPKKYFGKCPDLKVGDKWYEHEGFNKTKDLSTDKKKFKTTSNMIGRGVKQSDRIIIEDTGCEYDSIKNIIRKRIIEEKQDIKEVWVIKNNKLDLIYKTPED